MSKHKRKGRAIDHYWQFVKYKGNEAYYAKCSCGFQYVCDKSKFENYHIPRTPDPEQLYNYCPICGARKTKYYPESVYIDKYWFEFN